ncbi:SDR family oxidoreductase [Arenibaculum pallidiluteum]|uniref:SDR family oxidoreductase n=1 Tax=Arenibaculum pallidiluteum TaxID=2812559 RepID=UPI001A97085B|nr:SDR family oxidoreductase [Arenibaculum pallidiluteum]
MDTPFLFCFGLGYSARALARRLAARGWRVAGTARAPESSGSPAEAEIALLPFERGRPLPPGALDGVTHLLSSIPPDEAGDPVLDLHGHDLARLPGLRWAGYLSTTGVYGDYGGAWVDEETQRRPTSARARRRVAAEDAWLDLFRRDGAPVHLFRLAGIYGPGRSPFDALRDGTAKRIHRPGQVFSRIHVDDIAGALEASIASPVPGAAYNLCDDEPAPPAEVTAFAAGLLGIEPPLLVPYDEAALSPMARTFWADNKRVRNDRIKRDTGFALLHPDYRSGLRAILQAERQA